jgi:plastocyanin
MNGIGAAALALPLLLAATPAFAQTQTQSAAVSITDSGFSPPVVNVPVGGSVTWTNQGTNVHTVTTTPATATTAPVTTPAAFDSGGVGPGQTFSFNFTAPGTYIFTSATDCLNGNVTPGFACTGYSVVVGGPAPSGAAQAIASAPPSFGPAPATGAVIQQSVTVSITDTGFSPATIAVATGGTPSTAGTVTFVNNGTQLHTATSGAATVNNPRFSPDVFDSGGLAPGDSKTFSFVTPAVYQFNSSTDCLNGNNNPTFNCGGNYTITVVQGPVGSTVGNQAPPFSGPIIYWRDPNGFDPATITIKAGQTVTWMNLGHDVHSIVSDNPAMPFDSGGLGVGSVFTVTFTKAGTFPYHSSTEPIWSGNQITGYQFKGTVVVQ